MEFKQKLTLLFGFYFKANQNDSSILSKEAFQTQTVHVLSNIIELLQGAWILELPAYEAESKANKRIDSNSHIVLLSNKLYIEFNNLRTVLQSKTYANEDDRSKAAFKVFQDLYTGIGVFFTELQKIKDAYENKVIADDLRVFNSDDPQNTAAIHLKLRQMDLEPNFNML